MKKEEKVLSIKHLQTGFQLNDHYYNAVDDVSFDLASNEILAIVGESGCGKSTLATTIMGLLDRNKHVFQVKLFIKIQISRNLMKIAITRFGEMILA
ncbi:ATP-binding cassette domain-containing protein [Enterococcus rivorum]|uniref:ATP-binding cassette domain-containing protein n=1 Tax=Enterococcus rivorum TaxID=762845 RepID=UPI00363025EC